MSLSSGKIHICIQYNPRVVNEISLKKKSFSTHASKNSSRAYKTHHHFSEINNQRKEESL